MCMTKQMPCTHVLLVCLTNEHQQPRQRWPSVPYAPNVALSRNLVKTVVAVAVVLGSEAAAALVTQNFVIRGTRACRPAKHDPSPE